MLKYLLLLSTLFLTTSVFAQSPVCVSGAGTTTVNGTYSFIGTDGGGCNEYQEPINGDFLYLNGFSKWAISDTLGGSQIYYSPTGGGDCTNVSTTGWTFIGGTPPAPTVSIGACGGGATDTPTATATNTNTPTITPTPTPTITNTATPTSTPTPGPYCLSNAGTTTANGTYNFIGVDGNGCNEYQESINSDFLYRTFLGGWANGGTLGGGSPLYAAVGGDCTHVDTGTWNTVAGAAPPPTVVSGACASDTATPTATATDTPTETPTITNTFVPAQPGKVFWGDRFAPGLVTSLYDGSSATVIATPQTGEIDSVGTDMTNDKVYWMDGDNSTGNIFLRKSNYDGSSPSTIIQVGNTVGDVQERGLSLDPTNQKIYYNIFRTIFGTISFSEINVVNYDGSGLTTIITGATDGSIVTDIAIDVPSNYLFYSLIDASGISHIYRTSLTGTGSTEILTSVDNTYQFDGIDVDTNAQKVYWVSYTGLHGTLNYDGTGQTSDTIPDANNSEAIAVDPNGVFFIGDQNAGIVNRLDFSNVSQGFASTPEPFPFSMALDFDTPTPTPSDTPTITPTPTNTATNTVTNTPTITPTPTVTPTFTDTPTSVPTPGPYCVAGAGASTYNGTYVYIGDDGSGCPQFQNLSGPTFLYDKFGWGLGSSPGVLGQFYVSNAGDCANVGLTGWNTLFGTPPAPTVSLGACAAPTDTPTVTTTATITNTPTDTATAGATNTPTVTQTSTPTLTSTPTDTATSAITDTPTPTETSSNTPTPTATNCPNLLVQNAGSTQFNGIYLPGVPFGGHPRWNALANSILYNAGIWNIENASPPVLGYTGGSDSSDPTGSYTPAFGQLPPNADVSYTCSTPTPTPTPTETNTPTNTPTNTATSTSTPTNTATNTPTITPTVTSTPTSTATPTITPTPTSTPTGGAGTTARLKTLLGAGL